VSLVTQSDASQRWDGGLADLLSLVDFAILNEYEANRIARAKGTTTTEVTDCRLDAWMSALSPLNPRTCFVITRGAKGAVAFRNGAVLATLTPAATVEVVDPTGAGDAFAAGFLHGIWSSRARQQKAGTGGDDDAKHGSWSVENVKVGLDWGCAMGTAAVALRGASNPPDTKDVLALYTKHTAIDTNGNGSLHK
jgi:sugar/nucleoside kinase (ribokinase family)